MSTTRARDTASSSPRVVHSAPSSPLTVAQVGGGAGAPDSDPLATTSSNGPPPRDPTGTTSNNDEQKTRDAPHNGDTDRVKYTHEWGIYVSTLAGMPPPPLLPVPVKAAGEAQTDDHASSTSDGDKKDDDDDEVVDDDDDPDSLASRKPTPLSSTRFFFPLSICPSRDEKHLLVADARAIRHINTVKRLVGVLSSGVAGCGIWRDHKGHIWIADTRANCIRKITAQGELVHVAGSTKGAAGYVNGAPHAARFNAPSAICSNGGDWTTPAAASSAAATAAGTSTAAVAATPKSSATPTLYFVCDTGNCCVRILTDKGVVSTLAGAPPEPPLPPAGGTANARRTSPRPQQRSPPPSDLCVVDGPLSVATFISPVSCAWNHADESLVIADAGAHALRRITAAGLVWTMAGGHGPGFVDGAAHLAKFNAPHGVAIDSTQRVFVADRHNHAVRVVTPNGLVHTLAGGGPGHAGLRNGRGHAALFSSPSAICLDVRGGQVYVADTGNHVVRRVHFLDIPLLPTEIGHTPRVLWQAWSEWSERARTREQQREIATLKLERQLLEQRREFAEYRRATQAEFAKVRAEQMQILHQLMSSMQNMQQ